ncbi:MAG: DinB family protein [Anaerolineales bacterium]|nr:DinB family protein [Anaerolineales bacterium]
MAAQTPESIARRLEKEGAKNLEFFESLSPADWQKPLYSDGAQWTVHELFTHFVESESSIAKLISAIVGGAAGVGADFDIDRWNASKVAELKHMSREELLADFKQLRAKNVEIVAGLVEGDLEKQGRHPFLGVTSIAEMLKLMYLHLQLHTRDVKRALGG